MKVKILKGTNQIGGCITEISTEKTKIILDFGSELPELPADNVKKIEKNPNIEGLTCGKKAYDAVFISHSHGDHIGLINYILPNIPVFVESVSKEITNLLATFTYQKIPRKTQNMEFEKAICVNDDIKVTPFIVDHSAYNSAMLQIEADGKKVLYTGDYRKNGYKGKILESTLKKIGQMDVLITEGTSLSRKGAKNKTEEELKNEATAIFQKYNQVFLLQASTNIDRITSFYKAAKDTHKNFIEDVFTCNITTHLENPNIPNPVNFPNVYTWIPSKYKWKKKEFKQKFIEPFRKYSRKKAYENNQYALMVKTSMLEDIKKLQSKGHVEQACLIYSMWDGYKEQEITKTFLENVKELNIDILDLHTSGHADKETIKRLVDIVDAEKVIPIHTTNREGLKDLAAEEKIVLLNEGEELEV